MNGIDGSVIVFMLGALMMVGGVWAYIAKDSQASVRNVKLTEDILTNVDLCLKKTNELEGKFAQAAIDFTTQIGKTNQDLVKVSKQEKNINLNMPRMVQVQLVTTKELPPVPTILKPVVKGRKVGISPKENN